MKENDATKLTKTKIRSSSNKKGIVRLRDVGDAARWLRKNRKKYENNN